MDFSFLVLAGNFARLEGPEAVRHWIEGFN
jgi:hypothetical protein